MVGNGKDGTGSVSTESLVLNKTYFSFNSRFASEQGTNPEELIAAAHASCFTMKLSFVLNEAGYSADSLETTAYVTFEWGMITASHLVVKASVAKMSQEAFNASVKEAELNCPVCRLLHAKISVEAILKNN
jgi:osmotically inducible protein OsmC